MIITSKLDENTTSQYYGKYDQNNNFKFYKNDFQ